MVCKQWHAVLTEPTLSCFSLPGDEDWKFPTEWGRSLTGTFSEMSEEFEKKGYVVKRDVEDDLGLTYEEFVIVNYPRIVIDVTKYNRTIRRYNSLLLERSSDPELMSCSSEYDVLKEPCERTNHAYMIYVEAAKGNLSFFMWLVSKGTKFDASVFYGIFYSGSILLLRLASHALSRPTNELNLMNLDVLDEIFGVREVHQLSRLFEKRRELLASSFLGMEGWRLTSRVYMARDRIADCIRIAVNRGHTSFFAFIEKIKGEVETLAESVGKASDLVFGEPDRSPEYYYQLDTETRVEMTRHLSLKSTRTRMGCYCDQLQVSRKECECQLYRLCYAIHQAFVDSDWYRLPGKEVTFTKKESKRPSVEYIKVRESRESTPLERHTAMFDDGVLYHAARNGHAKFLLELCARAKTLRVSKEAKILECPDAENIIAADIHAQRSRGRLSVLYNESKRMMCGYITGVLQGALQGAIEGGEYTNYLELLYGGYSIYECDDIRKFLAAHPYEKETLMTFFEHVEESEDKETGSD